MTSGDKNYPRGFVNQQPVLYGPRLGLAWDVFGNDKTAIRAGSAILYNMRVSKWGNMVNNPPAIFTPITYNGDMNTFLQTRGLLSSANTQGFNVNNKTPDNYNLTFGIQQDLGHSTLLDVSYLGVLGRHVTQTLPINTVPYGARFQPQNTDPTNGKPLLDNFFRPFPGYNNISWVDNAYTSNYNALLVSLNRRFTRGFQFGLAYTYSKYMEYTGIPIYAPLRTWSYGFDAADQTHNVTINYVWDLPRASRVKDNAFVGTAFDGWSLSGISQFVSGTPQAITFTTVQGTDLTGGGDTQRVNVVGNASSCCNSLLEWFNPAAFAVPGLNDRGNAGKYNVRGPGVNNWDVALSKRVAIASDKRTLLFRWEAYNLFNHPQFSTVNTAAKYDLTTGAQVNAIFGQITATRAPRVMQGSLRFTF